MAQNITLMGASYNAVPSVTLPKTGGGTASFTDVSDTTATAADVASGTYFYTAAGEYTEGTASGGGGITMGSVTITDNDADHTYYTDGTMTVVSSGNSDLTNEPMPVGSIFVLVREGMAPPSPFPMSVSGATKLADYAVGSKGIVRIYKVT